MNSVLVLQELALVSMGPIDLDRPASPPKARIMFTYKSDLKRSRSSAAIRYKSPFSIDLIVFLDLMHFQSLLHTQETFLRF